MEEGALGHGMSGWIAGRHGLVGLAAWVAMAVPPPAAADDAFRDVAQVRSVLNRVLENQRTGAPVPWSNTETGSAGTVVVTRTYYRGDGVPCREYERTRERSGEPTVTVRGTGCRTGDAVWSLDEQPPETDPPVTGDIPPPPSEPEPEPETTFGAPPARPEPPGPVPEPPAAEAPPPVPVPEVAAAPPPPPARAETGPVRLGGDVPSRSEE